MWSHRAEAFSLECFQFEEWCIYSPEVLVKNSFKTSNPSTLYPRPSMPHPFPYCEIVFVENSVKPYSPQHPSPSPHHLSHHKTVFVENNVKPLNPPPPPPPPYPFPHCKTIFVENSVKLSKSLHPSTPHPSCSTTLQNCI